MAGPVELRGVDAGRASQPVDWRELVQMHDDRDAIQASPDELPAIDIRLL